MRKSVWRRVLRVDQRIEYRDERYTKRGCLHYTVKDIATTPLRPVFIHHPPFGQLIPKCSPLHTEHSGGASCLWRQVSPKRQRPFKKYLQTSSWSGCGPILASGRWLAIVCRSAAISRCPSATCSSLSATCASSSTLEAFMDDQDKLWQVNHAQMHFLAFT